MRPPSDDHSWFNEEAECIRRFLRRGRPLDHHRQYTSHEKLALIGGSNGGLLTGAEVTQHPELARAVISAVRIYDMICVELDPNGSFNSTEFGKNPEDFKALYALRPARRQAKASSH